MDDHTKDKRGAQVQYNTPQVLENDGIAGTSDDKGKSVTGNMPSSSSGDDDKTDANSDLLVAWMQRLQFLTILTAFLASMDGELFSLSALNTQIGVTMSTAAREVVYACLAGALTFHICATILGYVASFVLIRYRIIEDDTKLRRVVCEPVRPLDWLVTFLQRPERLFLSVSRRRSLPPLSLLTRCYYTTLFFTATGFVLAVTGILVYMWAGLSMSVGIFATVCLGVSTGAGLWAIL